MTKFTNDELKILLTMAETTRGNIQPHLAKLDPEAILEIDSVIEKLEKEIAGETSLHIYIVEQHIEYEGSEIMYASVKLKRAMSFARGAANTIKGELTIDAHHVNHPRINTFSSSSDIVSYVVRRIPVDDS